MNFGKKHKPSSLPMPKILSKKSQELDKTPCYSAIIIPHVTSHGTPLIDGLEHFKRS
jgi:hypothetical protein